jgi:hypothetical protein
MHILFLIVGLSVLGLIAKMAMRLRSARREAYIRSYMFPPGLIDALGKRRPGLALKDRQLVAHALRQFFLAYLRGGRRQVSMPSQVADDLWHEFILYTKHYQAFCSRAFGRFMHHSPAVVLGSDRQANIGLRRVWWHTCLDENINPRRATRLPLLFALDKKLAIADGFVYAVDCNAVRRTSDDGKPSTAVYCGGDLSSAGTDGSAEGFGDAGGSDGLFGDGGLFGDAGGSGDGGGSSCGGGCGGS